jgi:type II secretory ATPase GspE/PulE/Tfp pilus assembly ATPase PilB-like protein
VFIPGDKAKKMILDRRPAREFDTVTEESEMVTLQEAGTYAAVTGRTTMEELVAAVPTI